MAFPLCPSQTADLLCLPESLPNGPFVSLLLHQEVWLLVIGSPDGGEEEEEKEVEQSSSGQTLLVWRPEGSPAWAAACHCEKWHRRLPRSAGSQKMRPWGPGKS